MEGRRCDEGSTDAITRPELAHVHDSDYAPTLPDDYNSEEDEREATELRQVRNGEVGGSRRRLSHIVSPERPQIYWYDPAKKFWRHQIRISVPHDDCRDHLANERTFLGYLRTSVALSMMGIVTAQLYRLEHSPEPSKVFGYYVLSKPLSAIFQTAALCMIIFGSIRFYRQQSAMAIGKVHAGGWEINTIAVGTLLLLVMMFAVLLGVDLYKSTHPSNAWWDDNK